MLIWQSAGFQTLIPIMQKIITVTNATYEEIKNDFTFIKRDPIQVKGKGLMTTYFVEK